VAPYEGVKKKEKRRSRVKLRRHYIFAPMGGKNNLIEGKV